ncbi:MAG: thermonuclease family protein [Deltaproteobacteria bacterium]|nr:thermonuclease family protein [Deltaproteobacteria bacterium]
MKRFSGALLFLFLILIFPVLTGAGFSLTAAARSPGRHPEAVIVRWVIDGDTIVLPDGEKVRYAGIDAPEVGEPFYKEAKRRNIALVRDREVNVVACDERPRDKYGRLLAWVYVDGVDVSGVLLKEGLARVLTIPPCGLKKVREYRALESVAMAGKMGIWGAKGLKERKGMTRQVRPDSRP